ncbi:excinuclease ABC subunit A [Paraburkholderia mimosarum]|uniref:excinuclease ABC subunit A n=1 Tax=Paraburkholderia mimosarum TaxID=312026 RepID=UPI00041D411A|nr:excinuclease ABC subunit A [Paraburkholderia mimosarum]
MKKLWMFAALCAAFAASHAQARNTVESYPVDAALRSEPGKVSDDIALYFAGQPHPAVKKALGQFSTNKKTNAFGKTDEVACQHVFLSAVAELQERARKEGGNAVINIKSNYKNELRASDTEFTCGAGAMIAGVALVGEVVTLKGDK